MNKSNLVASLNRLQKILKIGAIVATVVFGVILLVIFIWEVLAPYTQPMWIVWTLIVVTFFPYLFAVTYFANEIIIKICVKKQKQT